VARKTEKGIMKKTVIIVLSVISIGIGAELCAFGQAGSAAGAATIQSSGSDKVGVAGFFVGLAQSYPWIATLLLIIGALRVVVKPVMSLLDGYIKDNCSPEEYAKLQSFEAGPIYKWISFGLDLVGSVKLPLIGVKPAQKANG
jgi:hypothetical protein